MWPVPGSDAAGQWVLVAQPDPTLGSFIEVNLRLADYEGCRVADGESPLRAATGRAPAAVVVAGDLPDTDRVGVVARLRQNPATCHAPVLVTGDRGLRETSPLTSPPACGRSPTAGACGAASRWCPSRWGWSPPASGASTTPASC